MRYMVLLIVLLPFLVGCAADSQITAHYSPYTGPVAGLNITLR